MPDLANRSSAAEIMDNLESSGPDLHQALRELETINYLLGGNYVTLNGIKQLIEGSDISNPITIVDLGCGSGDMLRWIRRWLEKKKIKAHLKGIDANPNVVKYATAHTPASCEIVYETINIFSEEFKAQKFDIVTGTLFFHHFTNAELIDFFKQLRTQTSVGLIINDIHRHWFSYYSIKWLTKFFSKSAMVKHDAAQSVLRAFTKDDWVDILRLSGITHYRIKWCWAFRWQVIIFSRKNGL
jgi:2-polyprenyl-3-methyl-5-hydroxy-6-metoxy-1,4-benzoquinol methylase